MTEQNYQVGTKVKALFEDEGGSGYYPATIKAVFKSGRYKVEFEDGIVSTVDADGLKPVTRGRPASKATAASKAPVAKAETAGAAVGAVLDARSMKVISKLLDEKLEAFGNNLLEKLVDMLDSAEDEEEDYEEEEEDAEEEEEPEEEEEEEEEKPAPRRGAATRGRRAKKAEPEEDDDSEW